MKKTRLYGIGSVVAVFLCVSFFAHAAVPAVINYQSRLRNSSGDAIKSATKVSFSLYSVATGGSALWTETYDQSSGACAKVAPDANGYFSTQMGSCVAFPATLTFTTPLYLGVTVESDTEALPRVAFAPAPYAMNAVRVGNFIADTAVNTLTGEPAGTATAGTQGFNSSGLFFQGSGWDGSAAKTKGFELRTTATDASNYRLSVLDTSSGSESVSILNNGRVGIGITNPKSELEVAGIIYANDFRTRGGSISTTGDGTNDLIRFTRPKLLIGYTSDLNNPTSNLKTLISLTSSDVTFLEDIFFNKLVSIPSRQIQFGSNIFTFPTSAPASNGLVLATDTDGTLSWTAKSSGSVTSVGLSAPADFTVSGSPVTNTGTLGFVWNNQSPNEILAGPSSGVAVGKPSFRSLVSADIPNVDATKITTGIFDIARGGTGIGTYAKGDLIYGDAVNSLATLGIGSVNQVLTVDARGIPTWQAISATTGGTVTSVSATIPASLFTLSGSPITDSGTLTFDLATQAKNEVFIGPAFGANAKPTFRALIATDIPNLDAVQTTTGIFNIARIPNIPAGNVTGVFASSSIPALSASQITSGTFGVARGGTGLSSVGANGTVLTVLGGVPVWDAVPAGLGGSGTFGQLAFWSAPSTLTGNPKIIIDNTNSRLAIGTSATPATTLVVAGDTTIGGDVVPSIGSSFDLGSSTKHIRNAYIDDLYIYGGGGVGTSTISATQTVFNGISYNWPSGGLGNNFVLTTDTNGNLGWQNATNLVPESGWRSLAGNVRLGVITDKVGIGTAAPATKLDVVGDIQASGYLSSALGQIKFGGAMYNFPTTLPSAGQVLTASSTVGALTWQTPAAGNGGTVTSVGLSAPALFSITGSPIIASGTIAIGLTSQVANAVFAGPASGALGAPTFRSLNANDIPNLDISKLQTGTLGQARGGTGIGAYAPGDMIYSYFDGTSSFLKALPRGTVGQVLTMNGGFPSWQTSAITTAPTTDLTKISVVMAPDTAAGDGVLNIGSPTKRFGILYTASVAANTITVYNNSNLYGGVTLGNVVTDPIIVTGKLSLGSGANGVPGIGKVLTSDATGNAMWQTPTAGGLPASVAASMVFAGPIAAVGAPAFRALASIDIPALDISKLTTGTLPVARGGTGLSTAGVNGQVLGVVSGVPAWTAPMGEGATYVGVKTITGDLNVNGGAFVMGGNTIIDKSLTANLQKLNVWGGATINSSLAVRDIMPQADNLYPLGSPTKRFVSLDVVNANIGSLAIVAGAGTGKVLTSDALGNASWQTPAALGSNFTDIIVSGQTKTNSLTVSGVTILAGNTAIGIFGNNSRLDVNGSITTTGDITMAGVGGNAKLFVNGTIGQKGSVLGIDSVTGIMKWQMPGSSDRRLKENITELSGVLNKLDAIHGVNFTWKADKDKKKQLGVIAQDVEKVFPEIVSYDEKGMRAVNYPSLAAIAIQGVKELDAKLKGPLDHSIIPTEDNVYSLGSPTRHFKDIYVGPHTIHFKNPETGADIPFDWKAAQGAAEKSVGAVGKDPRTDVLVVDMAQAKNDIAMLKAQLVQVQAALAVKTEKDKSCRSESIPVPVNKAVGSGDWVVAPLK